LKDESFDKKGVDEVAVLAGTSGSLLDHPKEFIESRNVDEVILTGHSHPLDMDFPR